MFNKQFNSPTSLIVILITCVWLASTPAAHAGMVVLETSGGQQSGWQASWDSSLDPYVEIVVDAVTTDAVYIQKSAQFTQSPGPGGFPAIAIQFQQIAYPAVGQIIIADESITNLTGYDWTDFHMELIDGTDALFNDLTLQLGFYTSPLDNKMFSPDHKSFHIDGFGLGPGGSDAVVATGSGWYPGGGASDGDLYIDVVAKEQEPYTTFTLKETPTPEPTTLGLLALGVIAVLRWRRIS